MLRQHCIPVADASQIGDVRRRASRVAESAGLGETEQGAVAIIATELATNLHRYAVNGRVHVQVLPSGGGTFVELLAIDAGPGMDAEQCLRDGYSSGGTSGHGLGAVKRLAHDFAVHSAPGRGTVVMARIGSPSAGGRAAAFRWGAVSTPAPHEIVCGDDWCIAERGDELAVLIVDGLGHGVYASEAAQRAVAVFDQHAFSGPAVFCDRAHQALLGSRGAALALGHVTAGTVSFAGIGNIAGSLVSPAGPGRGMLSQNGTAGYQARRPQQNAYPWPSQGCMVMHSDGLGGRWSLAEYPGLAQLHPAVIAGVLHRDALRGRDDATVVVVARGHTA